MKKFFYRLSKWFLDLWRKVFPFGVEHRKGNPTIIPSPIPPPPPHLQTYTDTVVSSKDYGEYLLQSGKWKRNRLRNRLGTIKK